jgi:hypothetical protein
VDNNVHTLKSSPDIGFTPSVDSVDVFTPCLETSQPSNSEHTTSTPSSNPAAKNRTFEVGDRVVIAEVGSIHQGQHGKVVSVGYGSRKTYYLVRLDKKSHNLNEVIVQVPKDSKDTFLMKL